MDGVKSVRDHVGCPSLQRVAIFAGERWQVVAQVVLAHILQADTGFDCQRGEGGGGGLPQEHEHPLYSD